ncbi:hypothetical protein DIPPA_34635 [Diplonema papillatum]|nr:hypothetical protein DIPPA_34635 [Diplonema papillatum]
MALISPSPRGLATTGRDARSGSRPSEGIVKPLSEAAFVPIWQLRGGRAGLLCTEGEAFDAAAADLESTVRAELAASAEAWRKRRGFGTVGLGLQEQRLEFYLRRKVKSLEGASRGRILQTCRQAELVGAASLPAMAYAEAARRCDLQAGERQGRLALLSAARDTRPCHSLTDHRLAEMARFKGEGSLDCSADTPLWIADALGCQRKVLALQALSRCFHRWAAREEVERRAILRAQCVKWQRLATLKAPPS